MRFARRLLPASLLLTVSCSHLPTPGTLILHDVNFPVREYPTPSGLRVIVERDASRPLVAVALVVGVGSSADPVGKEGLAHLVEHLTFRAKHDGRSQLWNQLTYAGVTEFNATTWLDSTNYFELVPKEALVSVLSLEGARLLEPVVNVDEASFQVEREVVRNELRQRSEMGIESDALSAVQAALFPKGHPYARPVIGTHQSISAITPEDVRAFITQHYRPENVALVISGDVDPDSIGKLLDQTTLSRFTAVPEGGAVAPVARIHGPPPPLPQVTPGGLLRVKGSSALPQLYVAWSLPRSFGADAHLHRFIEAAFRSEVALALLRDPDITGVDGTLIPGTQATLLLCTVTLRTGGHPEASAEHVLDQLYRLWEPDPTARGVAAERHRFAQLRFRALVEMGFESDDLLQRAIDRAEGALYSGDPRFFTRELRALASLEFPELSSFAYTYLSRERAHVIYVEPVGSGVHPDDSGSLVAKVRASPDAVKVAYASDAIRKLAHAPGVRELKQQRLPNGLEVIAGRTSSAPVVTVKLVLRGGLTTGRPVGIAELAADASLPLSRIHGSVVDYGATESTSLTRDATVITLSGGSGNLPNLLAILYDRVSSITTDPTITHIIQAEFVPRFDAMERLSEYRADREFHRALFGDGAYGRVATVDDLKRLGDADVRAWLRAAYSPKGASLVIVGDVDPAVAQQLAGEWLGGWSDSSGGISPDAAPGVLPQAGGVQVLVTPRPGATQGEIRLGCALPVKSRREAAAVHLLAQWFGDHLEAARKDLGATYGIHAGADDLRGGLVLLQLAGYVDNPHLPQVLHRIHEEWDQLSSGTISFNAMNRARWGLVGVYDVAFATTREYASRVARAREAELPLAAIDSYPEDLMSVMPPDLRRAAEACRRQGVLSVVGDEPSVRGALAQGWR